MFENDLSLFDEKTIDVKVYSQSDEWIGDGELRISKNKLPIINFGILTDISPFKSHSYFRCEAKSTTYSLFECEVEKFSITPKLIMKGSKLDNVFTRISLVIDGVSEWMNRFGRFEVNDNILTRNMNEDIFNVDVIDNHAKSLSISCLHSWDTKHEGDNIHRISIHTVLSCEIKNSVCQTAEMEHRSLSYFNFTKIYFGSTHIH